MISTPKLEHRQEQRYAAIRTSLPIPFGSYLGPLWKEVNQWLKEKGVDSTGPALIRYLTTDMSKELDMDVGFTIQKKIPGDDRVITDLIPAGEYATLLYTGPYKGKGVYKATVALLAWASENQIEWDTSLKNNAEWWNGRVEYYLTDPDQEADTRKYRTELAFLVR
jgi:effector-binding domain-containing protein